MKPHQPNILMIMTDQQRYDSLGCYGTECISTPHLDRLASEGLLFENCYVNNPVCTPSRASIFTGKEVPAHGVQRLHDVLPDEETLFPFHLQRLGYTTALFGKLHVSGRIKEERDRHAQDGFDIYEWCMEASISLDSPFNGYSSWLKEQDPGFHERLRTLGRKLTHTPRKYHMTHWAAQRTIEFIEGDTGEKPFFCLMSVFDPHNPYDGFPLEYLQRVDQAKLPMPKTTGSERAHTIRALAQEQRDGYLGRLCDFTEDDFRAMRTGYFASLALLDDEVGRVLETLDRKGIAQDTLVIFVSDHGDMLGDHGLLVKGAFFYDPCVKVPLILRQPGVVPAGVRTKALVQPHDLAATILAAAGKDSTEIHKLMPKSMDIRNALEQGHETAVCSYRETGIDRRGRYFEPRIDATMITDGHGKLIVYHPQPDVDVEKQGQYFNLDEDPKETNDLWFLEEIKKSQLTEALEAWLEEKKIQRITRYPQWNLGKPNWWIIGLPQTRCDKALALTTEMNILGHCTKIEK